MTLLKTTTSYFSKNRSDELPEFDGKNIVIVGEFHGHGAQKRMRASVDFVQNLMRNQELKFFGNESFLNRGVIRQGVRDYLKEGLLPPKYNPEDENLHRQRKGRNLFVNGFKPILDKFKKSPKLVLCIGSAITGKGRDSKIALNFLKEAKKVGLGKHKKGILLLGAAHASAKAWNKTTKTTTRMHLEKKGFKCTSIALLTEYGRDDYFDDQVHSEDKQESFRLSNSAGKGLNFVPTRKSESPFEKLMFEGSSNSIASQFEYLAVVKRK